ncbi:MAG: PTS sugar transporter subunit IIA [Candidatus Omnitrophica bacterium]|nr:PTS sugar transporter subunit IIA [Candidatus Omnitrophota bacterium]
MLSDHLKKECCIMDLKAETVEGAIREISERLNGMVLDRQTFVLDVLAREKLNSTGIGYGVAIPHARTNSVKNLVIGFGRAVRGIDFNAIDGQKVNFVFVMGAHPREIRQSLGVLSELSKLTLTQSFRDSLKAVTTSEEVIALFKSYEDAFYQPLLT